ncbi:MAG: HEPN domain-containing protein [Crocosphaera sp.]|nr:HEPN domain-containing protein [Crocosphaera sp.]
MNYSSTTLNFEILALDTSEKSNVKSAIDLLYLFRSYGELWKNASLDERNLMITDGDATLEVQKVNSDVGVDKTFLIKITGNYDWLEAKRINILNFLYSQKFDSLYVLLDQVSEQIACTLYPLIYQLENTLRTYLTKFMVTKVGLSWWKITATNELSKKVNDRKNNEKEFSEFIDNKLYLADFGDLGQLIYKHSSGFITKEDILKKIFEVEETPEAIRKLKNELQSNYQKFFCEHFKDKNFQKKWEEMEKIRHKVAHNNLFTNSDLETGKELFEDLINIITTATEEVDKVILQQEEKEAIEESIENSFEELDNFISIITETKESANRALSSLSEPLSKMLSETSSIQKSLRQSTRGVTQKLSEEYDKSMQSQQEVVKHFSERLSEQTNQCSTVKHKNNAKRNKKSNKET